MRRLFLSLILAGSVGPALASDWNSWRGPNGDGSTADQTFPSQWDLESDVQWKTPLPGPGNSSPIVHGDQVFVTQYDPDSKRRELLCFNAATGAVEWRSGVVCDQEEPTHPTNPYCAASPVTDGHYIVAFFGAGGLCCYDMDGQEIWQKQFGAPQHLFGQGASPTIHGEYVTMNYGPGTEAFWVTLDLATGDEVWRLEIPKVDAPSPFDQPDGPKLPPGTKLRDPFGTWATPLVYKGSDRTELILAFPNELRSVDPATGKTLWTCDELGNQILSSPLIVDDIVVTLGSTAMAVKAAGDGDVTDTHRLWFEQEDRPRIGTAVSMDGKVIANTMQGIVEAIDLESGDRVWQKRLRGSSSGGGSWSSLVRAGDRVIATNKDGSLFVFRVTPEYELLATNKLEETTNATPAIANNRIYVRTDKHLWCIGS